MPRQISFLVIGGPVTQSRDSNTKVAGRCLEGPILLGDHFREVKGREDVQRIDLVVEEISAYGKLLGRLDPVVTGELILSGDIGQPLADHAVLSGEAQEQ